MDERNVSLNESVSSSDRDETLAQAEVATLSALFIVIVLGNSSVLLALSTRRRKKLSRMYYFILHLSIADLITALLSVLPQLAWDVTYRFQGGPILCKVIKYGQTLGPYLSAYVLLATALDRYQAVCNPLAYCSWTSRRSRAMVWFAWAFALAFCVPQVVVFSYQEVDPGVYDCWATFIEPWGKQAYVTWYSVSVFLVPLAVLTTTYSCVCREIWRHAGRNKTTAQGCSPLISRAKMNTVKQMVAVLALYIVCSTPFICTQLWSVWDPEAMSSPFFSGPTFTILALLSCLNSCVNPWIYLAFNRELVRLLKQQFTCRGREYNTNSRAGSGGSGSSTGTAPGAADCSSSNSKKRTVNPSPKASSLEEKCHIGATEPSRAALSRTQQKRRRLQFSFLLGTTSREFPAKRPSEMVENNGYPNFCRTGAIRRKESNRFKVVSETESNVRVKKSSFLNCPLRLSSSKKENASSNLNPKLKKCVEVVEDEAQVMSLLQVCDNQSPVKQIRV